jgi:hypothetical protein
MVGDGPETLAGLIAANFRDRLALRAAEDGPASTFEGALLCEVARDRCADSARRLAGALHRAGPVGFGGYSLSWDGRAVVLESGRPGVPDAEDFAADGRPKAGRGGP